MVEMHRPGWNPLRRNKNIGTAKSGRGRSSQLQIPHHWIGGKSVLFHERLERLVAMNRTVRDRSITILVEPVQPGFIHACTPEDIIRVLTLLPAAHIDGIDLIVMRQPKRKERLLEPVWGRLRYWTDIQQYNGTAIHLDAQQIDGVLRWSKSLCPNANRELERLLADGHRIVTERRHYAIYPSPETTRSTQLYRTLPHEVGHYVDFLDCIETTGTSDRFWCKTNDEKEAFAHRYATEFYQHQLQAGNLPFDRLLTASKLEAEGLDLSWFETS
jgi:hypothetical protein